MKILIGGYGACSVHNETFLLRSMFQKEGYELTKNINEADLIIFTDSCVSNSANLHFTIEYLKEILRGKKEDTEVIISGCLAKGFKGEFSDYLNKFYKEQGLRVIELEDLIEIMKKEFQLEKERKESDNFIFTAMNRCGIGFSPVQGCLNNCSFCKVHYTNFDLKSYPFELLKENATDISKIEGIHYVSIFSSNFTLYGVDLYKTQRAHEVIKLFTEAENIKYASVGTLINWYKELEEEIIRNQKIKTIYSSLETGSKRLYDRMNRPIPLEEWKRVIKRIRQERPDIMVITELLSGYPTETIEDIKKTVDLVEELELYLGTIFPYIDFPNKIPSSAYPQHSFSYNTESAEYIKNRLQPLSRKIKEETSRNEFYILAKNKTYNLYYVLYPDGQEKWIRFDQLEREYKEGETVQEKIKPKSYVKKLERTAH